MTRINIEISERPLANGEHSIYFKIPHVPDASTTESEREMGKLLQDGMIAQIKSRFAPNWRRDAWHIAYGAIFATIVTNLLRDWGWMY